MSIAIIVHGGAGSIHPDDRAEAAARGCLDAANVGYRILEAGGSALDAAAAACAALEDDPLFNAGTGSCLNEDGEVEMDAAIMEGKTLQAGGVALVRSVKNPIVLAQLVLQSSHHVLLAGEGAERFARERGMPPYPPSLLVTERSLQRWKKEQERHWAKKNGTVGAVARDQNGNLAAATSTGGTSGKRQGRIGDSPLPGSGLYADDLRGAASATGDGEAIIRVVLCKFACDRISAGVPPSLAAREAMTELERVSGTGGIILLGPKGDIGIAHNTERMSYAFIDSSGNQGSGFHAASL